MDKKHLQDTILAQPYNRQVWQEVLRQIFGVTNLFISPQNSILSDNDVALSAYELGNFYTADDRLIGIYEITLKEDANTNIARNKVGLRSLLRNIYKYDVDAALVVFVHGDKWRFSYVSEIRTKEGKQETEPKRYTYLFGKGESCRTATDRFLKLVSKPIHLNDLFEAFSVEKLTKEFFKTYKEFYEKGVLQLTANTKYYSLLLNTHETDKEKQEKPIRDFVKKLLGRIVFLHFLQKKGWLGCPADKKEWTEGNPQFMRILFDNCIPKSKFHSRCLKVLFFETLNTDRRMQNNIAPALLWNGQVTAYKIPYLNGGLFDRDISYEQNIDFDEHYFANLFDFFEQYNFTIDENDPYDNEVGIDPEMLGHIFENLLEENKDKGAFYTPKEIVHYMCRESLIQYLRTNLPECTEDISPATIALEQFIKTGTIDERRDKKNFIVQNAKKIERLLDRVKICDPAIGSGAFPMGMLQEIFKAKTTLDLTLDYAEVKKQIIQNSIYGVDIESGAVDIARLRFWLALVVDETEPQPLPNLDYKIMQGNSLLESFENIDLHFEPKTFEIPIVKDTDLFGKPLNPQYGISEFLQTKQSRKEFDLTELEETYFNSNKADEKQAIKKKIDAFEKEFIKEQIEKRKEELNSFIKANKHSGEKRKIKEIGAYEAELILLSTVSYKLEKLNATNKPYFLWHLYFMDVFKEGGFDIVIGNPPYIDIKKLDSETVRMLFSKFKTTTNRANIFAAFIEFSLSILNKKGVLNFIVPNSLLVNDSYIKVREQLVSNINTIVKTPDSIFESAVVETVIFFVAKDFNSKLIKGKNFLHDEDADFNEIKYLIFERKNWILDSDKRFNIFGNQQSLYLLYKIEDSNVHFEDEFDFSLGITPYDKYKGHTEKMIEERTYHSDIKIDDSYVPLISGNNIQRYLIKGKVKEYLSYGNWLGAPREIRFFKDPKVVVRQILSGSSLDIIAAYSEDITFFTQIGFSIVCKNKKSRSLKILLSILNSKVMSFYHKYKFLDTEKVVFPKILIANCKKFPLPKRKEDNEKILEQLVNKIIVNKGDETDTSNYENKIDALVFHLYNFTEEEMMLILNSISDLSINDKNQIQNEYWNIANNIFQTEV